MNGIPNLSTNEEFREQAIALIATRLAAESPTITAGVIVDLFIPMIGNRIVVTDHIVDQIDAGLRKFHVPETFNTDLEYRCGRPPVGLSTLEVGHS